MISQVIWKSRKPDCLFTGMITWSDINCLPFWFKGHRNKVCTQGEMWVGETGYVTDIIADIIKLAHLVMDTSRHLQRAQNLISRLLLDLEQAHIISPNNFTIALAKWACCHVPPTLLRNLVALALKWLCHVFQGKANLCWDLEKISIAQPFVLNMTVDLRTR